jgi:hypothetical protein
MTVNTKTNKMEPTNEQLNEVRNALMECWTVLELNYVTKKYHDIIYHNDRLLDLTASVIRRILTVKNTKETIA